MIRCKNRYAYINKPKNKLEKGKATYLREIQEIAKAMEISF